MTGSSWRTALVFAALFLPINFDGGGADYILVKADLKDGDAIVTEGLQRVREGGAVRVAGEVASNSEPVTQ